MTVRSTTSSADWWASELTDITCLLCGHGDGCEVEATAGGDAGRDGSLDERGVREYHPVPAPPRPRIGQQRKSGEDRTAEVRDEQHPVSGVRGGDRGVDALGTGAEPAVIGSAGRYHADAAGDLCDEFSGSLSEADAVRDENDAYHEYVSCSAVPNVDRFSEGVTVTRAVERAAQILVSLAAGSSRLGVSEISELVDIPKPRVHTMLRTLERHGLVEQEVEGGKYALGPAVLQLGNAYLDGSELRARSAAWADPLARQTGESVWVGVLSGHNVVVVHHAFRPDDLVQILEVGAAVPWHACALGHAIVACLNDDRQKRLLSGPAERLTGRTVTDPETLRQVLETVRERGYAVEDQEATLGDAGLAAPVFDWTGRAVGALGVVGPAERLFASGQERRLADAVRSTARALSRDLGAAR